jgi:uncharacterized protein YutE (UPF0331/DUF86 family)
MDQELLGVKLNQLLHILSETENWIAVPLEDFKQDTKVVRASQRNLQLLVEYASDINGLLVLEFGNKAPGSYRESFTEVFAMDIGVTLSLEARAALLASVDWRNELIHEYEPAESHETFYAKLKEFLAAYRSYARAIHDRFGSSAQVANNLRPTDD